MVNNDKIYGLAKVGDFLNAFLRQSPENYTDIEQQFNDILKRSEVENPWFDSQNMNFALESLANLLKVDKLNEWLSNYPQETSAKKVGLILAGNIPMVGWHDVIAVILAGHKALVKLSSKDRLIIPFLLKLWKDYSMTAIDYELVDRLEDYDAVIATGSNNTARYLEYYFKDKASIIRKNRTSVAVLSGEESDETLQKLAKDVFTYYGLGCRNVTRLFLPLEFKLDRLFENFLNYNTIINHNKYANNYDYNRAIYLLNQDLFWDNNFVMLKEDEKLFCPLAVLHFSRYTNLEEVENFISEHNKDIQAVVSASEMRVPTVAFGEAQYPSLDTYADDVDTMTFLTSL